ncbi:carbohydrate kinase [Polaribacter sp. WD7]|uniref:carbohydrate kinase family protein n=1 Tax=Polaribacter sp. WD7 TaxID=2269061 RepID=UPI000DF2E0AF|nr:carbohydrate kinase [Polaribacter sp. WD7]RCS27549.1 carbohydrate kinase [Polaribacter sp. WD7]
MHKFVCFGEVLFDVFPDEKKIGGAPLNVACRLQQLENEVALISAVGDDKNGQDILSYLKKEGVQTEEISILENQKTGEVEVSLNTKGNASYTIPHPSAWDKIPITSTSKIKVAQANAFVFGSLSTRDDVSKETLYKLLEYASYPVFDVNLRAPFYTKDILIHLMNKAKFIKFNDEELYEIAGFLDSPYHNLEQNILFISHKTSTKHICVTKGEHGGVLLFNEKLYYNSGYKIKVKDTVGAGDSFLATLLSFLLQHKNPQKAIDFACAVGAMVAANSGANPKILSNQIESFVNSKLKY